jgi:hypothetical protein
MTSQSWAKDSEIMKHLVFFALGIGIGVVVASVIRFNSNDVIQSQPAPTPSLEPDEITNWHQPLRQSLDTEALDLSGLYSLRAAYAVRQDEFYFGQHFDYAACEAAGEIDLPVSRLDEYQSAIQTYQRALIAALVGDVPPQLPTIPTHLRETVLERDSYRLDYVVFGSRLDGIDVHAYVLTPTSPPATPDGYPGIVLLHPNTDNIEGMVGINPTLRDRTNGAAIEFVQQGAVVIVPYLIESSAYRQQVLMAASMTRQPPYRTLLVRIMSAIDWLFAQSDYPVHRIGVYGLSYGGILAMWTGIADPRVDVTALSNSVRDYSYWLYGTPDDPLVNPNPILWLLDWCEWDTQVQLRLIVPRRLYIESSSLDEELAGRDFTPPRYAEQPVDMTSINRITDELQEIYNRLGIADRFRAVTVAGEHEMFVQESVPWLMEQLTRPADAP